MPARPPVPPADSLDVRDGGRAVAARTCGRCRQLFDGDPTLHPTARAEWWACPACRVALFGPGGEAQAHVGAALP